MNPSRLWTLGAVTAIIAIFGGAVALGVQPHLAAAAAADDTARTTVAQNGTTQIELARLSRAAATESTLQATDTDLERAVPPSLRMNSLSRMLLDAAALDDVTVEAFTPTAPVPYAPVTSASTASSTSASTSTASSTPTPTPSATATPTASTSAADTKSPWFGVTDPLITADDFTVVPTSVTVKGSASGVKRFATDAQQLRRLFAVTTVSTTRSDDDGSTTGVIAGYVYTLTK